jgi:hypothetical protein
MSFKLTDFNERTQRKIRAQLEADIQLKNAGKVAKLERDSGNAPLEAKKNQRSASSRFLVRIESRRKRLLDEDNICEKYLVDLLRYSGIIANDSPDQCRIEVSQTKCRKGEPEEITIEVFQI